MLKIALSQKGELFLETCAKSQRWESFIRNKSREKTLEYNEITVHASAL